MKFSTLLLLFFISFQSFAQVSVAPKHNGPFSKFEKDEIAKFKNTETIFLLSNVYDKELYEKILKDSWDVTPYQIVTTEEFNIGNYLSDKYSIARLSGFKRTTFTKSGRRRTSLFTYIDFIIFDSEEILKKLKGLSDKKKAKEFKDIIEKNSLNVARFYIFPKDDFIETSLTQNMNSIVGSLYDDDVFFNYKPGLLKNYFQKVNSLIKNGEGYWMYKKDHLPELKALATKKLYVPSYMAVKYNAWKGKDSEENNEYLEKMFKKYKYEYELISDDDLSNKIMDNEEFYYLRYVRMNAEKFLQVVNSKTGEIVYRDYMTGLSYKLKPKNIKALSKKIDLASR